MSTIRDQVVELADVPGGVSNKELQAVFDLSPRHVNMHMTALVNQGRVHPAKRAGDRIRWFKRVAVRDAWMLEMQRGETMYTVVPKAKRACDKPTRQGPKLVDVHEHLPSRARWCNTQAATAAVASGSKAVMTAAWPEVTWRSAKPKNRG